VFSKTCRSFERKTITDDTLRLLAKPATLKMLQHKKGREGKGREGKGREGKGREGKGREGKGREGKKKPFGVNLMRSQVSYRVAQEGE